MSIWEIILNFIFLIIGFCLLIKGADWFVDGASMVAEKLKIPQIVIGLTIVAMGTSLPEAAVSISASVSGTGGIAVGNVIGSNITNVLLILGLCGMICPLMINRNTLWIEIPFVVAISVVLLLMGLDGNISRIDGGILLGLFAAFFVYLIITSKKGQSDVIEVEFASDGPQKKTWWLIFLIIFGAACVVGGSQFVVTTASDLAKHFGMTEAFIGLTIVAIGTSLPELVTSIMAAKKNKADLAIGNIVGSNIFNILFVLGLASVIKPIGYAPSFLVDNIVAIGAMVAMFLAILFTKDKKLKRIGSGILFAGYIAYFVWLLVSANM